MNKLFQNEYGLVPLIRNKTENFTIDLFFEI